MKSTILVAALLLLPGSAIAQGISDAEIAAIVVTANQVDIDAGKLAVSRAGSEKVKTFAQLMITDHSGVTDSNRAYVQQMDDAARRAVLRCSPFKNLPAELYRGGWDDFDFRFRPEQMQ